MSSTVSKPVYHRLVIQADHPTTDIWVGDDEGYFVQKATDTLDTRLLPGNYTVEFGLGTATYPIRLTGDSTFRQAELAKGPTCARVVPDLSDETD